MDALTFLLCLIGGGLLVWAPLYFLFFGGLEKLIRRDEGNAPIVNSFSAAARRTKQDDVNERMKQR